MEKSTANLLNPVDRLNRARRCRAMSKRSGQPCKAPAMRGKAVCRCHGGKGGAPKGKANGAWRHGHYAGDALTVRQAIAALNRLARATVDEFD